MFFEKHLYSEHEANNSATSGVFSLGCQPDFDICGSTEWARYLFGIFSAISFAFGFPAAIAILWEAFKSLRRGTPLLPNDFLVLNLSVMDGVFLAFLPPGLLNHFIFHSSVFESVWNGFYTLSVCGRPLIMACICVDCYLAVVHPITYHKRKSLTPRIVIAGVVWTLTVISGILYIICSRLYFTMFSTVPYITAMVVIGYCDSFIVYTLAKSDPGRKKIHPQKQRAIQTIVNSLVMTVLSYLPPVIMLSIGQTLIGNQAELICNIGIPMTIPSTVGSTVMPLLHLNNQGKLNCIRIGFCRKT